MMSYSSHVLLDKLNVKYRAIEILENELVLKLLVVRLTGYEHLFADNVPAP